MLTVRQRWVWRLYLNCFSFLSTNFWLLGNTHKNRARKLRKEDWWLKITYGLKGLFYIKRWDFSTVNSSVFRISFLRTISQPISFLYKRRKHTDPFFTPTKADFIPVALPDKLNSSPRRPINLQTQNLFPLPFLTIRPPLSTSHRRHQFYSQYILHIRPAFAVSSFSTEKKWRRRSLS